jgi:sugar phosphate isomerase/epimerase
MRILPADRGRLPGMHMSKPISIQMYTVRELTKSPDDFRRVVKDIADIGYAAIETGGMKEMKPEEFRKFLSDLGLHCSSMWAQPKREILNELVETAGTLGFKCYVGCYGPDQVKTVADCERTAAAFEEMAALLAPHGLSMCYHNHWWEFTKPADGDGRYAWDIIMSRAPQLSAQIDIYWASNFGELDVPAVVRKYASRTPLLHAKDGPLIKDQANTAVGKGKLDNAAAINSADPDVLQYIIVELDKFDGNIMDAVRDSYNYLTRAGLAHGRKQ